MGNDPVAGAGCASLPSLCCHTFREIGIIVCLLNCEMLELAQQIAAHGSARTRKFYNHRDDKASLDKIE